MKTRDLPFVQKPEARIIADAAGPVADETLEPSDDLPEKSSERLLAILKRKDASVASHPQAESGDGSDRRKTDIGSLRERA